MLGTGKLDKSALSSDKYSVQTQNDIILLAQNLAVMYSWGVDDKADGSEYYYQPLESYQKLLKNMTILACSALNRITTSRQHVVKNALITNKDYSKLVCFSFLIN